MNDLQNTRETIAINLIRILRLGPLVSFNGSPTVSPTTAALWIYEPLVTTVFVSSFKNPASIYFLALSQAPPVFEAEIANWTPETIAPGKNPTIAFAP